MSRFNEFIRRADDYAKGVFAEYAAAESKLKDAKSKHDAYPRRIGMGYEYDAKVARYEIAYAEAKAEYEKLRGEMYNTKSNGLKLIRSELEKALSDVFAANPEHIDAATLELLKSGIMSADEHSRLIDNAIRDNNPTMARLVAKYAMDRATEADANKNTDASTEFRSVAIKGDSVNGNSYLETFDVMVNCFNRCMNNVALMSHWDELNSEIVENF